MKKKQIEKVPYIMVSGVLEDEKAEYVAVTAWKNIGKERHIFLEVYKNRKEYLAVPIVRYVATKKDWGVFFPESGTWTRQSIESNQWRQGMCWYGSKEYSWNETLEKKKKKNQLYSEKELIRIKAFFGEGESWKYGSWWNYFKHNEEKVRGDAVDKRNENRKKRLREREGNTPLLPEKEILEWAESNLFQEEHHLYYRKKGRKAEICCSKCGGIVSGKWKAGESFKEQFERRIEEPVRRRMGRCTLCGAYGQYRPQGEVKGSILKEKGMFTADKYLEKGVVIRYVNLQKKWVLEEIAVENETEMSGAYEELSGIEVARAYFLPGKKVQIDYHKRNPISGKDFWDDCNLYGMNNIKIEKGVLYPEMTEKLRGTCLQYSAIESYARKAGAVNAVDYMERYREIPQIEMLVKAGLYGVVEELVKYHCGVVQNQNAARPEEFLGIRKEHIRLLIREEGNIDLLRIMQIEKRMGKSWKDEQLLALKEIGANYHEIEVLTNIMTIQKALNQIARYAGCEYGTGCAHAEERLRHIATTYVDYLEMRKEQGYDLTNTIYQRPRNLEIAHNNMVEEKDKEKIEKRIKEAEEKYPEIRKRYRGLRKKYYYEDETYLIRPARSAKEIIKEGRILHHCVGGDSYLESHNKGYSIILFLRYQNEKDMPYITVEIRENTIVQWYGAYDKKPNSKSMQKWLDSYVRRLRCDGVNEDAEKIRIMAG